MARANVGTNSHYLLCREPLLRQLILANYGMAVGVLVHEQGATASERRESAVSGKPYRHRGDDGRRYPPGSVSVGSGAEPASSCLALRSASSRRLMDISQCKYCSDSTLAGKPPVPPADRYSESSKMERIRHKYHLKRTY